MHVADTALNEVKYITLPIHKDARGTFCERFNATRFAAAGIAANFVQDNCSHSIPGVIRGLHFQYAPAQGKLVGVTRGRVLDVAVDIRPSSPDFGKHVAYELSEDNGGLLWIPAGFAHGFCVLGDAPADVYYKVTAGYAPEGEAGICYNDPGIGITWPAAKPILSGRDAKLPTLAELKPDLARWFA